MGYTALKTQNMKYIQIGVIVVGGMLYQKDGNINENPPMGY